ncbi:ferredoxin reductase family protein [Virgisporangium aurantiacum]|uniref:Oxidoreductase n=1 Tax=Virgisporangium aurantiacum TaxID=175570 RepID=A0A8J3Z4X0_9ACTN|nr:ferredoxin reductase family protein [Virgisporangium aurantiacum]GIJ55088.1 oxidoreductase [Virgisporangium aurantiacum]
MTATSQPLTRARPAVPPATLAQAVLWTIVVVNLLVLWTLFAMSDGGKNTILTIAKFFGMHVALIMMFQLLLISRLPWLDRRIGMDRLTVWHRWTGFTLLWFVVAHATFIVLGYATLDGDPPWRTFFALASVPDTLFGMSAATIIVVVAVASVRYARRKISYETWHAIHFLLYAALLLGLIHQFLEPATYQSTTWSTVYWWTLWALVLTALAMGRFVLPLYRNMYHQFRVAAVVPESDNVVSVHVTGRNMDKFPGHAGQFMIWRFLGHNRWWQANPFSLSAAPNGRTLRLTAKAVGKTSAGLRHVPVGTRVFAEGPYGAFTAMHRNSDATLLIAGGVGITPIRSLLEECGGNIVVLYRAATPADAVLWQELQALAQARGARLHLLTGRTGAGNPPNTPFEPPNLLHLVPDIVHRDVFVCGPPAMTNAVLQTLRALRVPKRQIHHEKFGFA